MKILVVDDEKIAVARMKSTLEKLVPDADIHDFNTISGYKKSGETDFDVAFLDIELGTGTGLELALMVKEQSPKCNIVFVTGYSEYALEAFKMHSSGYVLKPFKDEDIQRELDNLRFEVEIKKEADKPFIKTFGTFDVLDKNGNPIHFKRSASKEILAYLVNANGEFVSTYDIAMRVFKEPLDSVMSKKISQYTSDLSKDLSDAGFGEIIIKQWKKLRIKKEAVDCDLYRLLNGDTSVVNTYHNEYMLGFDWAKFSPFRKI